MTVLTDAELELEARVLAYKLRICELEADLRWARGQVTQAHADLKYIRESTAEALGHALPAETVKYLSEAHRVLQVQMEQVRERLGQALSRPTRPGPERCTMHTNDGGPRCLNPALPGSSLCAGPHRPEGARGSAGADRPAEPGAPSMHTCKVIDLDVRFRRRDLLVPDPDGAT